MARIIGEKRAENGLDVKLERIVENPYLLCERFVGDNPDDGIPFSRIDHGVFPSPDLGGEFLCDADDPRRLSALCVDRLKFETKHAFMTCGQMLQDVNRRLASLPEWKRVEFTDRYLEVDRGILEQAIVFRREGDRDYAYLRTVYDAERKIEGDVRDLVGLSDITFKSPVTASYWKNQLFDAKSPLAEKSRAEYEQAIETQGAVCAQVFNRPISVICGAAGTGKTTIIAAIFECHR
jgi:exodeoxyribonuclease V alpha subunit